MGDELDVDERIRRREWEWLERIACTSDVEVWPDKGLSFIAIRSARLILEQKSWIEEQADAILDLKARVEELERWKAEHGRTMEDVVWTETGGGHGRATLNGLDLSTSMEGRLDGGTPRRVWKAFARGDYPAIVAYGFAGSEEMARRIAAEYARAKGG